MEDSEELTLGDRCKQAEMVEAGRRAERGKPLLVRLDGRAFHTFTRNLQRPFDERFIRLMIETTKALVNEFNPLIAYSQSDEISLVWYEDADSVAEYVFGGRYQKLCSVLAGFASGFFCKHLPEFLPEKAHAIAHFDARAWQVATLEAAKDVLVWREFDARKNSVTMLAQSVFSHKALHGRDTTSKLMMLFEKGIDWTELPAYQRRGGFFRRVTVERALTAEERERIPEAHRPSPDTLVKRHSIVMCDLPPLHRTKNLTDVLFRGAEPIENRDILRTTDR